MEKKLEKQWKRLDVFANMSRAAHNYLQKMMGENPAEKEHCKKIDKELSELFELYRKRLMKKMYDNCGGQTPFDEDVDGVKLEPETYEECMQEYNSLLDMFRCSIRYLSTFEINTPKKEKLYVETVKKYRETFGKYEKRLLKRMDELYEKVPTNE